MNDEFKTFYDDLQLLSLFALLLYFSFFIENNG